MGGALCAVPVAAALAWFALPFAMPLPPSLASAPAASPVLLDRHGAAIAHLALPDFSRSRPVALEEIPRDMIACTLAAEDKRFFSHGGIDLLATMRAARDLVAKRHIVSGASTISQQLVKISSPAARRNPLTKIRESLTARHLEMSWTKEHILAAYLNRLDYGNLRTGIAEAARFYFQKPLADLSLAECALLAGLPQAPSRLNPVRNPARALVRRDTVLHRLAASGNVDPSRISAALAEPLELRPLRENAAARWLPGFPADPRGKIPTTLDLPLQRDLEAIVRSETGRLRAANLRHAAIVVIDNPTGEILALVSSADWDDARGGQLNGALVPRSPGSALKPFTYLLALESGLTPASILADVPTPFRTPQGLDLPENYDRTYRGPVTLRTALACSLNVPALRELNALGGPRPLFDLLGKLGISTLGKDPGFYGLGLTLGNAPVRLLDLANAYATLARQGCHFPATLFSREIPTATRIFAARDAWLITDILSDPAARAPAFQPGGPLDLPFRCAVKTGTSSDFCDNWCVGFTPRFTVGVWAGNFERQPMKGISGIAGAGPIFHRAMLRMHREIPAEWFPRPDGIAEILVDSRTGKSLPAGSENHHAVRDFCPPDRIPAAAVPADFTPDGKAQLDATYAAWFASPDNRRRNELALNPSPAAAEPLRIVSPANNALFLLDPEIPSGSDKLRPVTNLPGKVLWQSDTLRIEPGTPEPIIHLTAGTHVLTATDPATGTSRRLTLRVRPL